MYGSEKCQFSALFVSNIFQDSVDPIHQKLWEKLDEANVYPSMRYGVTQILADKTLGMLMESTHADQFVSQYCPRLTRIKGSLGSRLYALGFPKGSPYVDQVSHQILVYHEEGRLAKLRHKWFGSATCSAKQDTAHGGRSGAEINDFSKQYLIFDSK